LIDLIDAPQHVRELDPEHVRSLAGSIALQESCFARDSAHGVHKRSTTEIDPSGASQKAGACKHQSG
jgi:hypothetical protein